MECTGDETAANCIDRRVDAAIGAGSQLDGKNLSGRRETDIVRTLYFG